MNRLLFLVEPDPDAVQIAADLILILMLERSLATPFPIVQTRTLETGQIEIIAEYPQNDPSAPLLHPLNGAQNPKTTVCTSRIKKRRCTASARLQRRH